MKNENNKSDSAASADEKTIKMIYTGTKRPIAIHELRKVKKNGKKVQDSRIFYQVNMCFGANWKLSSRENSRISRKIAASVSKWLQKHGSEVVRMALEEKISL